MLSTQARFEGKEGACSDLRQSLFIRRLSIIVALYLAFALSFAILLPPWETPDAPSHYLYIRQLIREGHLPTSDWTDGSWAYPATLYEWHHPPLYYALQSTMLKVLRPRAALAAPPFEVGQSSDFSFGQPSARFPLPSWPWWRQDPTYGNVLAMRVGSVILIGLPCVIAAGWVGHMIDGALLGAVWAASLAFLPQFIFVLVSIQNDALAILWSSAIWALVLATESRKLSLTPMVVTVAGMFTGLALVSKMTVLPVVALAGLWLLVSVLERRLNLVKHVALFVAPILVILTLYAMLGGNHTLAMGQYLLGLRQSVAPRLGSVEIREYGKLFVTSFWGRFGWMNVPLPVALTVVLTLGLSIGCLLLLVKLLTRAGPWQDAKLRRILVWMAGGSILQLLYVLFTFFSAGQPQGRFLFPSLLPLMGLALLGWYPRRRRFRSAMGVAVIGLGTVTNVVAVLLLYQVYWMMH